MNFRTETEALLKDVEVLTGSPVEIFRDPDLPTLPGSPAPNRVCRRTFSASTQHAASPTYLIAYECGFILRLFQVPPEHRYEFATAATTRPAFTSDKLPIPHLSKKLPMHKPRTFPLVRGFRKVMRIVSGMMEGGNSQRCNLRAMYERLAGT